MFFFDGDETNLFFCQFNIVRESTANRESTSQTEFTAQYYNQFLSNMSTLWTVNDQRKLKALHSLHHRMVEYHNNIHTKDGKIDLPRRDSTADETYADEIEDQVTKSAIIIAHAIHFYSSEDLLGSNAFKVHTLTFGQLDKFCNAVKDNVIHTKRKGSRETSYQPFSGGAASAVTEREDNVSTMDGDMNGLEDEDVSNGFTWIHLKDLLALETIAEHFDIHELIVNGFSDLRTHSTILPCIGESLMSIIACGMECNDFNMYKLYIYVSKNLVLTFQAELLPDITEMDIAPSEKLVQPIFDNFMKIRKKCIQLGPAYLVYELALQALRMWDSSLEFISYALSYFNKIVHLNLLHREKLELMIKMNTIYAGAVMFQNGIDEANNVFSVMVSALLGGGGEGSSGGKPSASGKKAASRSRGLGKGASKYSSNRGKSAGSLSGIINNEIEPGQLHINGSGIRRYLVPHILQDDIHTPYFIDLADAFLFTDTCLQNIVEDLTRVSNELDATIQLRSTNTSIILSLVATIFLPLTFFAGVFGMNFTVDGGYTMQLLNSPHGPTIFIVMCVGELFMIFGLLISSNLFC